MTAAPITYEDKVACLCRELAMRRRAYPRWVEQGRMTHAQAEREIAVMAAILDDYPVPDVPRSDLFGGLA